MRTARSSCFLLIVLAALLLAGACGGDDDTGTGTDAAGDGSSTTTAATPSDDGGDGDECRFVPTSAVQEVFGETMELRQANQGCVFGDGEITLQLSQIDIQIDPEQYADEALEASCDDGTVVEVDAGDRAYACISFVGPLGNLYEGRDLVVINTQSVEDENADAVRDQLAELLPAVSPG